MAITQREVTTYSCNEDLHPQETSTRSSDAGAPASQAREDTLAPVVSITQRVRDRAGTPPPREADGGEHRKPVLFRSPWSEDSPSPRMIVSEYAAEIAHYWGTGWGWGLAYGVLAVPPLAIRLIIVTPLEQATQRPARLYFLAALLITCWLLASL
jgi:hypothetical protein